MYVYQLTIETIDEPWTTIIIIRDPRWKNEQRKQRDQKTKTKYFYQHTEHVGYYLHLTTRHIN